VQFPSPFAYCIFCVVQLTDPFNKKKWLDFQDWYGDMDEVREGFLGREILFACGDEGILAEAQVAGIELLQPGDSSSQAVDAAKRWRDFRCWYWHGKKPKNPVAAENWESSIVNEVPKGKLQNARMGHRNEFLILRAAAVMMAIDASAKLSLKKIELNLERDPEEAYPETLPIIPDIFEEFTVDMDVEEVDPPIPVPSSLLPWEFVDEGERDLELAMAMCDVAVQAAAGSDGIMVPEPAQSRPSKVPERERWEAFAAWHAGEENPARDVLLRQEAEAASVDEDVSEEFQTYVNNGGRLYEPDPMENEVAGWDEIPLEHRQFLKWYFNYKDSAYDREPRRQFLQQRVAEIVRTAKLRDLHLRNKMPASMMVMDMPPPAEDMEEPPVYRIHLYSSHVDSYTLEDILSWFSEEDLNQEGNLFVEAEVAERERIEALAELARQAAWEQARLEFDRKQAEAEDRAAALARLLNRDLGESDDEYELDGPAKGWPFAAPPEDAEFITTLGYVAGSGLVNGDEEAEARELREEELRKQKALEDAEAAKEAQEASRLADIQKRKDAELAARQRDQEMQEEIARIKARLEELKLLREKEAEEAKKAKIRAELAAAEEAETLRQRQAQQAEQLRKKLEDEASKAAAMKLAADKVVAAKMQSELESMAQEDALSWEYQRDAEEAERIRLEKTKFLTELYEPFTPYFEDTDEPLLWTGVRVENGRRLPKDQYAMSRTEELLMTPEVDKYAFQMSSKFSSHIGVPVSKSKLLSGIRAVEESQRTLARSHSIDMRRSLPRSSSMIQSPSQSTRSAQSSLHSGVSRSIRSAQSSSTSLTQQSIRSRDSNEPDATKPFGQSRRGDGKFGVRGVIKDIFRLVGDEE
jgi:hypothetical protein